MAQILICIYMLDPCSKIYKLQITQQIQMG